MEFMQRYVKGYGWLPLLEKDGFEVYRGEFQVTPQMALKKAVEWLEKNK